jgi:hypothetical protein
MLRIRILSVAAATTIATVLAASGAIAQTASSDQPGKPLLLATPSGNAAATVKRTRVRHVASRKHSKTETTQETEHPADKPADPAQSKASADAWLSASAPPSNPAPTSPPAQANNTQTAAPNQAQQGNAPLPSAVVVNGQTVPIGTAEEVNALDLAADNSPGNSPLGNSPPMESTLSPGDRADLAAALTAKASQVKDSQVAFAAPTATDQTADGGHAGTQNASAQDANAQNASAQDTSAQDTGAQDTGDQSAAAPNSSTIGSASWVAQVLAALGGAMAAGTLAWFLIGGGPPARDYG